MPIAARIIGDVAVATFFARADVPAECGGAAGFDRQHHTQLAETQMPGVRAAALLGAFARFDPDYHALAVDVGVFERDHFTGAQTRAIGDAQRGAVFGAWRGVDQTRDLFSRQHRAELLRSAR